MLPLFRRGAARVSEKVEEKTEQALTRTRRSWFGRIAGILDRGKIDEELWLDLEEVLLGADVGVKTTEKILDDVRARVEKERVRDAHDVRALLKEELRKVKRVIERKDPSAPHEVLLVLDATTGQNALIQAKAFTEAVEVTAIALTKLDGTSKGGIVFAISDDLGLPVRFVGTGEGEDDLNPFDAEAFVDALFE